MILGEFDVLIINQGVQVLLFVCHDQEQRLKIFWWAFQNYFVKFGGKYILALLSKFPHNINFSCHLFR